MPYVEVIKFDDEYAEISRLYVGQRAWVVQNGRRTRIMVGNEKTKLPPASLLSDGDCAPGFRERLKGRFFTGWQNLLRRVNKYSPVKFIKEGREFLIVEGPDGWRRETALFSNFSLEGGISKAIAPISEKDLAELDGLFSIDYFPQMYHDLVRDAQRDTLKTLHLRGEILADYTPQDLSAKMETISL